ncbi:MFS transporter [Nonomuraea roseoviolacea]|uniref:MFS family permease n=1 Tax=Nonomuraea roseoviolacea subsp. carminata TaxID=160689 RepID=A0ABT1K8W4_9ACTN|nr:MFS transporter [Nonomuraea roseoviolacea]MCP2350459.1 MFS family permease [Nonomuraea roseoviolacea subsp. carminata]
MIARYMFGAVTARTGDEMSGPALLVAGLALTGSPVVASWLLAGLTASAAIGGPLLGVLLDRAVYPGRMLAGCLLGYTAGLLAVLLGLGHVPDAALVAVAVLAGLLGPALTGGWTAQLPLLVPAARLERASALDAISYNAAGLAGPAVVAGVAAAWGGQSAVVVSLALLVAAVPIAYRLPARTHRATGEDREGSQEAAGQASPAGSQEVAGQAGREGSRHAGRGRSQDGAGRGAAPARDGGGGRGIRQELAAGFTAIARNAPLRRATVTSMVSYSGVPMFVVAAPLLGAALAGAVAYGALLLAVTAGAALAANAVLARRRGPSPSPDAILVAATLLLGVALALAAVAPQLAPARPGPFTAAFGVAVVAAVLAGVAEGPQLTALLAVRHREAPPELRSQIFTTGASLKITSFAAGSTVAGPLAGADLGAALLAGAALQVAAVAAYALLSRGPRRPRP